MNRDYRFRTVRRQWLAGFGFWVLGKQQSLIAGAFVVVYIWVLRVKRIVLSRVHDVNGQEHSHLLYEEDGRRGFSGPDTEECAEPIPYSTELTSGLGQNAEGSTGQEPRERG